MVEEVCPIVDIDQNVGQIGFLKAGFDQILENLYGVGLIHSLQGGEVELAFLGVDCQGSVLRSPLINLFSDRLQAIV